MSHLLPWSRFYDAKLTHGNEVMPNEINILTWTIAELRARCHISATSTSLTPVDSAADNGSSSSSSSAEPVPLRTRESTSSRRRLESDRRVGRWAIDPMPESVVLRVKSAIITQLPTSRHPASVPAAVDDDVSISALKEPHQQFTDRSSLVLSSPTKPKTFV